MFFWGVQNALEPAYPRKPEKLFSSGVATVWAKTLQTGKPEKITLEKKNHTIFCLGILWRFWFSDLPKNPNRHRKLVI